MKQLMLVTIVVVWTLATIPPLAAQIAVPAGGEVGELGLEWSTGPFVVDAEGRPVPAREPEVVGVVPCSPAHLAGIEPEDRIVTVNDRHWTDGGLFPESAPGSEYTVHLIRDAEPLQARFRVGARRENVHAAVTSPPVGSPESWDCVSHARWEGL